MFTLQGTSISRAPRDCRSTWIKNLIFLKYQSFQSFVFLRWKCFSLWEMTEHLSSISCILHFLHVHSLFKTPFWCLKPLLNFEFWIHLTITQIYADTFNWHFTSYCSKCRKMVFYLWKSCFHKSLYVTFPLNLFAMWCH